MNRSILGIVRIGVRTVVRGTALFLGGLAALRLASSTSIQGNDHWDSPLFLPAIAGLALAAALAGRHVPEGGRYWGLVAMAPFVLVQISHLDDSAHAGVGLVFLVPLVGLVWLAGNLAAERSPPRGHRPT